MFLAPHGPPVNETHYSTGSTLVSAAIFSLSLSNTCTFALTQAYTHTDRAGGRAAGALTLSHWPGQLTGGVCEADGSAGIVCVREVA